MPKLYVEINSVARALFDTRQERASGEVMVSYRTPTVREGIAPSSRGLLR